MDNQLEPSIVVRPKAYLIPVVPFSKLKVTTITIVAPLDVEALNYEGFFLYLSCLDLKKAHEMMGTNLKGVAGKEVNVPGEIIGMRYRHLKRGLIDSQGEAFPTAITLKVGTSIRPVNIKFSQKLKITGAPNYRVAKEAVEVLLQKMKTVQAQLSRLIYFIQNYTQMIEDLLGWVTDDFGLLFDQNSLSGEIAELYFLLLNLSQAATDTFPSFQITRKMFVQNLLREVPAIVPVYQGKLECIDYQPEMMNVPFDLGFTILQENFVQIMNKPPFNCYYNNADHNPAIVVTHHYKKVNRKGLDTYGKHTFKINRSGYVMYSGPNSFEMEIMYNTLLRKILENIETIYSREHYPRKITSRLPPEKLALSSQEWEKIVYQEHVFRYQLLTGQVPLYSPENDIRNDTSFRYRIKPEEIDLLESDESASKEEEFIFKEEEEDESFVDDD